MRTLMFPSGWTLETAPSSGQKSLWFVSKNLQNCRRSHWTQWTQCLVLVSMSSKVQSPFKIKITFSQVPHTKLLSAFDPSRLAPVEHTHTCTGWALPPLQLSVHQSILTHGRPSHTLAAPFDDPRRLNRGGSALHQCVSFRRCWQSVAFLHWADSRRCVSYSLWTRRHLVLVDWIVGPMLH